MKKTVVAVSLMLAVPFFAGCSTNSGNNDGPIVSDTTFTLAPDEPTPSLSGSLLPGESPLPRPLSEEQAVIVSFLATLPNNLELAAANSGTISVTDSTVTLTGVPSQKVYSQQIPQGFIGYYGESAPGSLLETKPVPLKPGYFYCFSAPDPADKTRFFKSYDAEEGSLAALPDTVIVANAPC